MDRLAQRATARMTEKVAAGLFAPHAFHEHPSKRTSIIPRGSTRYGIIVFFNIFKVLPFCTRTGTPTSKYIRKVSWGNEVNARLPFKPAVSQVLYHALSTARVKYNTKRSISSAVCSALATIRIVGRGWPG